MIADDGKLPALRPVEVMPIQREGGELFFALHDPTGLARESIAVSAPGYFVLMHLDGAHSSSEIRAAFRAQVGMELPADEITRLVETLDAALYLSGARVAEEWARRRAEYLAAPARDNRGRYGNADELRAEIEDILDWGTPADVPDLRGLIAPHLDYARGKPCYSDAYATLARVPPAARYIILGTNHNGQSTSVVATGKDFQTPLGLVPTDREFIAAIESALDTDLRACELDHRDEHSVELQVQILQIVMRERPFEIVPVLCPDVCGPTGTAPFDGKGPDLADFAAELGRAVDESDRRTIIIAGADLSHVGQRFGDPQPTTPEFLQQVERSDRRLLSLLEARKDEEFVAELRATENATRICSTGCIYALLRALPERPCRVLRYHQAVDMPAETHVTCAAALIC